MVVAVVLGEFNGCIPQLVLVKMLVASFFSRHKGCHGGGQRGRPRALDKDFKKLWALAPPPQALVELSGKPFAAPHLDKGVQR